MGHFCTFEITEFPSSTGLHGSGYFIVSCMSEVTYEGRTKEIKEACSAPLTSTFWDLLDSELSPTVAWPELAFQTFLDTRGVSACSKEGQTFAVYIL